MEDEIDQLFNSAIEKQEQGIDANKSDPVKTQEEGLSKAVKSVFQNELSNFVQQVFERSLNDYAVQPYASILDDYTQKQ